MVPPLIRHSPGSTPIDKEIALRAIDTVKEAVPFLSPGPALIARGPGGELHVDVPLMYQSYALDRIHFDPVAMEPSPKGRPVRAFKESISREEVANVMDSIIRELKVLEGAEYREPERAWIVPLAWGPYIVAHVRVSSEGNEIIPDYGLTEEVRRYVL
ncbi:MAG: hypothetical protein J7J65_07710 [Candidatus Korarchaeota archaeon]|nr:hypothetical protein [Candidatus Korarchaeota archaeon]